MGKSTQLLQDLFYLLAKAQPALIGALGKPSGLADQLRQTLLPVIDPVAIDPIVFADQNPWNAEDLADKPRHRLTADALDAAQLSRQCTEPRTITCCFYKLRLLLSPVNTYKKLIRAGIITEVTYAVICRINSMQLL